MSQQQVPWQARHGDVFLQRVDALPAGATERPRDGDVILALGEVTGHAHRIRTKETRIWDMGTQRYLVVPEGGGVLEHEEHGTIAIPSGAYQIVQQREYHPLEIRQVAD